MNKTRVLQIRLTPDEYDAIAARAQLDGHTPAAWGRLILQAQLQFPDGTINVHHDTYKPDPVRQASADLADLQRRTMPGRPYTGPYTKTEQTRSKRP
jgi:hypothetical protein